MQPIARGPAPSAAERQVLEEWARGDTRRAVRARIVLRAAEGDGTSAIAQATGVTPQTVRRWSRRFAEGRLEGLRDRPRPGAPRLNEEEIERLMAATLHSPPPEGRRWTTRSLARATGLSQSTVSRVWRAFGVQPVPGAPSGGGEAPPEPAEAGSRRVPERGARLRRAAFRATWDLLEEGGWFAVSIDAVAKRVGVHRSTLYRLWRSPIRLVVDAAFDAYTRDLKRAPETGSLRGDVAQFARIHAGEYAHRAAAAMFAGLILERERHPEIARALREMELPYIEVFNSMCDKALARGELSHRVDVELLMEVVAATVFLHRVVRGEPVDEEYTERLARLAVEGLAHSPLARRRLRAAAAGS